MKIRELETRGAWWEANGDRARVKPLERPPRAEIVRTGRVVATVYQREGEALDEMQDRAQRMAGAYSAKVVIHEG